MIKSIFKVWLIVSLVLFVIVWTVRPDMIEKAKKEIVAPYYAYISNKNSEIWSREKENLYLDWISKNPLPQKCNAPSSALIDLECNSVRQNRSNEFEAFWTKRIQSGWKPKGLI